MKTLKSHRIQGNTVRKKVFQTYTYTYPPNAQQVKSNKPYHFICPKWNEISIMEQDWASLSIFIKLQSTHIYHSILGSFQENYSQSQATSDNTVSQRTTKNALLTSEFPRFFIRYLAVTQYLDFKSPKVLKLVSQNTYFN